MDILVIDDSAINRTAAQAQLEVMLADGSYEEVVVASSYDEGLRHLARFDVVLIDLLMPASGHMQGAKGRDFVGQEMPVGIFLALLAAKRGAKYVAVFTDSDHHSHPASACFDPFNESETRPTPFTVEGAQVWLCNNRHWINAFQPDNLAVEISMDEILPKLIAGEKLPWPMAKNWLKLLNYMLGQEENTD